MIISPNMTIEGCSLPANQTFEVLISYNCVSEEWKTNDSQMMAFMGSDIGDNMKQLIELNSIFNCSSKFFH